MPPHGGRPAGRASSATFSPLSLRAHGMHICARACGRVECVALAAPKIKARLGPSGLSGALDARTLEGESTWKVYASSKVPLTTSFPHCAALAGGNARAHPTNGGAQPAICPLSLPKTSGCVRGVGCMRGVGQRADGPGAGGWVEAGNGYLRHDHGAGGVALRPQLCRDRVVIRRRNIKALRQAARPPSGLKCISRMVRGARVAPGK